MDDVDAFPRFSGLSQRRSRFGFKAGETDMSGFGYDDGKLLFQISRGRQDWGAGNNINLALSSSSPPYDYLLGGINLGLLKLRYFNGFLESDSLGINRFISSRGFEINNFKNFIFSVSELVIYSGINRPMDFPISILFLHI